MLINEKSPHGGDIYTNKVKLDFSANINPFGMPEKVKSSLLRSVESCSAYPDPYCTALREKISAYERVPAENILCGNGAAELIYLFAYSLPKDKPALIVSPTFSEYEQSLRAAGIIAKHYILNEENGFRLTGDILSLDLSQYCAVFVCSPNNPTGVLAESGIIYALAERGVRLFCDFCFLDLTERGDVYDVPSLVSSYPNAVVLKAFTKSCAMAGVRLGYAMTSDTEFITEMSLKTQCWNVSTLAQTAGAAALECQEYICESVKLISAERERMKAALTSLGIKVYPGEANYLLMYTEKKLYSELRERGIMVRDCSGYVGLGEGYIRCAVRGREENDVLLENMEEILK